MPYEPIKKGTLLVPSGSYNNPDAHHLHVILTDACTNSQHLLVSITSIKAGISYDDACVIEAGEHAFIGHRSYVYYRRSRQDRAAHLTKCVEGGLFHPRDPVSDALFERICEGIELSRFIPRWVRNYYRENS